MQHLLGRHLRLGDARARGGTLRARLARRHHERPRQAGLPRVPGDAERGQAALDVGEVRGGPADRRTGPARAARLASQPLLQLARVPGEGEDRQREAGRALQGPPGPRRLAHLERVQRRLLLQLLPGRVPRLAEDAPHRPRRPQQGVLGGVLGAEVPDVGADRPARGADGRAPARLGPLRDPPDGGLHEERGRPAQGGDPGCSGHHEHDDVLRRPGLLALRRCLRPHGVGRLPAALRRLARGGGPLHGPRLLPHDEGRPALPAHGVDALEHQLAADAAPQAARPAPPGDAPRHRPRRRRHDVLPMAEEPRRLREDARGRGRSRGGRQDTRLPGGGRPRRIPAQARRGGGNDRPARGRDRERLGVALGARPHPGPATGPGRLGRPVRQGVHSHPHRPLPAVLEARDQRGHRREPLGLRRLPARRGADALHAEAGRRRSPGGVREGRRHAPADLPLRYRERDEHRVPGRLAGRRPPQGGRDLGRGDRLAPPGPAAADRRRGRQRAGSRRRAPGARVLRAGARGGGHGPRHVQERLLRGDAGAHREPPRGRARLLPRGAPGGRRVPRRPRARPRPRAEAGPQPRRRLARGCHRPEARRRGEDVPVPPQSRPEGAGPRPRRDPARGRGGRLDADRKGDAAARSPRAWWRGPEPARAGQPSGPWRAPPGALGLYSDP